MGKVTVRVLLKAFKALGNETRLKLLATLLGKGEMTVTQLARQLGMSHSRVSRNLGILETNNFVKNRQSKRWVYYSMKYEKDSPQALRLIVLLRKELKGRK